MPKGYIDQQGAWDHEYRAQKLLSPSNVPHADVVRFVRWLKKRGRRAETPFSMEGSSVLDLGSGTGRNAYYFAEHGAHVTGFEFSPTALEMAERIAAAGNLPITYLLQDIGSTFPIPDRSIDIALDVTSSNSLSDAARATCLHELHRVLKPDGMLFLRALSFESDAHAKELVRRFPGPNPDTYVHPDLGIIEKVFSRDSLQSTYEPFFTFAELQKVQHYATVAGRMYKRSYWVAYLQKRSRREEGAN